MSEVLCTYYTRHSSSLFMYFHVPLCHCVMFESGHCLSSQPAMVTWRSSDPFPGSYITPTRNPVIVLFAQAGFSKCGRMGGGLNHTVCSLSNKPAVCHPSHHWSHPLSGPPVCPPSLPSVLLASHGTVLTGISVISGC